MLGHGLVHLVDRHVEIEEQARCPSSRTMLWIQKNERPRAPRVTGVT